MVKLIIRANNSRKKEPVIKELRITIEEVKLIIRICKEVKVFNNFKSFETAINQVTEVSGQTEGGKYLGRRQIPTTTVLGCK